jgi:hypothetical protein
MAVSLSVSWTNVGYGWGNVRFSRGSEAVGVWPYIGTSRGRVIVRLTPRRVEIRHRRRARQEVAGKDIRSGAACAANEQDEPAALLRDLRRLVDCALAARIIHMPCRRFAIFLICGQKITAESAPR